MLYNETDSKREKFRKIAKIEGISFILLVFIASPLKHLGDVAIATKIMGPIHGALWMWFLYLQYVAHKEYKWDIKFNIFAFIMSIVPFGTIWLDKKLKEQEAANK